MDKHIIYKVKHNRWASGDPKNTASDGSDHGEWQDCSETEHSSNEEDTKDKEKVAETRVLKMLYKGSFCWRYRVMITQIPGLQSQLWLLQLKAACVNHLKEETCHSTLGLICTHFFGDPVDTKIKLCIWNAVPWHIANMSRPLWSEFADIHSFT